MNTVRQEEFNLRVDGFKLLSLTNILILAVSILLSAFGLMFVVIFHLFIILIFKPNIIQQLGLERFPIKMLGINSRIFSFISLIPGINFNGQWYIEPKLGMKKFSNIIHVSKFLLSHLVELIFIGIGLWAFGWRIAYVLAGRPEGGPTALFRFDGAQLNPIYFYLIGFLVQIVTVLYLVWVWTWEDAELRIADRVESSKGGILETTQLWSAASSIKYLFGIFTGINAWIWWVDTDIREGQNIETIVTTETYDSSGRLIETSTESVFLGSVVNAVFLMAIFSAIFLGPIILFAVAYYRSGVHEDFVNRLRHHIYDNYTEQMEEYIQRIGTGVTCTNCEGKGMEITLEKHGGITVGVSTIIPAKFDRPPQVPESLIDLPLPSSTDTTSRQIEAPQAIISQQTPVQEPLSSVQTSEQLPCPNCGVVQKSIQKFCTSCGHQLKSTKFCPSCGTENKMTGNFCVKCGDRI